MALGLVMLAYLAVGQFVTGYIYTYINISVQLTVVYVHNKTLPVGKEMHYAWKVEDKVSG